MSALSWLHISDFHFRTDIDKFSQEQACQALLEGVKDAVEKGQRLAFAVVTGDIAFSGQHSEYEEADAFLGELAAAAGISGSAFYFVPGNHDVDRSVNELAYEGGVSKITSSERVDYYLSEDRIAPLLQRQSAFWSFVDGFTLGQERHALPSGLGYISSVAAASLNICILGLNSAWLSGSENEDRKLVIGERQVIDAIAAARASKPDFMVAIAHHPLSWLSEWDEQTCGTRLLPTVDLFLRGHLHSNTVSLTSSPQHPCIEVAAGSSHATRFYGNAYNIVSLDPSAGSCTVQGYKYVPSDARFEASEPVEAPIAVPGSIPGTREELARTIASEVPAAAPFSRFMAGLLTGQLGEVPILEGGSVLFVLASAAGEFVGDEVLSPLNAFLGLRNLLRLGDQNVPLEARISANAGAIADYAASLAMMTEVEPGFAPRLQGLQQASITVPTEVGPHRWSLSLLDDYRREEDWEALESHSRTLAASTDARTSRLARSALAEALIRSDEPGKRQEAFETASELASRDDASPSEVVLAAAAAEASDQVPQAVRLLEDALRAGHRSTQLINYGRELATRFGSLELRQLVDEARHDATEQG